MLQKKSTVLWRVLIKYLLKNITNNLTLTLTFLPQNKYGSSLGHGKLKHQLYRVPKVRAVPGKRASGGGRLKSIKIMLVGGVYRNIHMDSVP